jgi:Integrase core domain
MSTGWDVSNRVGPLAHTEGLIRLEETGFELVYVPSDDYSGLSYVDILADERSEAASTVLRRAAAWFAQQKVKVERVMTDNGSAFLAKEFAATRERSTCVTNARAPTRTYEWEG